MANLREDSSVRAKCTPRDTGANPPPVPPLPLPKRYSSSSLAVDVNDTQANTSSNTSDTLERMNSRKSMKISNTFIRKQGSAKIIQKIKSHKALDSRKAMEVYNNATTNDNRKTVTVANDTKTEHSNVEVKLPPLQSGGTLRVRRTTLKSAEEGKTLTLSTSSRNIVPPILSPGKISRQNTMSTLKPKAADVPDSIQQGPLSAESRLITHSEKENHKDGHNKENIPKPRSLDKDKDKELTELLSCLQKMIELEQNLLVTDKDQRKQLEEVRGTLSTVVGSLTQLSQKLSS